MEPSARPAWKYCPDTTRRIATSLMLRIQSSRTAPILAVIFSLLSAGLLLGCTAPSGDDYVLPDSVLALVLADLHLAGAELQFGALRDSLLLASIADGSEKGSRDSVLE
ncbi:MAG: hypothetical protein O7C39_04855, partial [Bacteroidetes bacterium]|nr:hypothetical protein [Bacteroidota bacterium]